MLWGILSGWNLQAVNVLPDSSVDKWLVRLVSNLSWSMGSYVIYVISALLRRWAIQQLIKVSCLAMSYQWIVPVVSPWKCNHLLVRRFRGGDCDVRPASKEHTDQKATPALHHVWSRDRGVCNNHHANPQPKRIKVVLCIVYQRLGIEPETDDLRERKRASILFHPLFWLVSGIMSLSTQRGRLWPE